MKRLFLFIFIISLSLNYFAQAQCRVRLVAPDANEWIENNQERIKTMTRTEWQALDEGYKWPVFKSLSPEKKHDFFRLKIEQVRDNFEWNKEEQAHINLLHKFFINNPDLYNEEDEGKKSASEKFILEWIRKAREEIKWSKKLTYGITTELDDLLDKEGNVRTTSKSNFTFKELDIEKKSK